jgi:hypothetical protein
MRAVETIHAEPRGSLESPRNRVNFWSRPQPRYAWNLEAYVLTDVGDVLEVLQWVEEHAEGRRYEVFAELDEEPVRAFAEPRTSGLVRLVGSNPNAGETCE